MEAELTWQGRTGTARINGTAVAALQRGVWRERVEVELPDGRWRIATERGAVLATDPAGAVRHVARGEGFVRRRWTLELDGRAVGLERAGGRDWQLRDDAGPGGAVRVRGVFRRRVQASLPAGTAPDAAIFVLWLADLFVRRSSAAAASGG